MSNRFDLEQEILECWKVVNDIEVWADQESNPDDFRVLAQYYEHKFKRLWDTFEKLVHNKELP